MGDRLPQRAIPLVELAILQRCRSIAADNVVHGFVKICNREAAWVAYASKGDRLGMADAWRESSRGDSSLFDLFLELPEGPDYPCCPWPARPGVGERQDIGAAAFAGTDHAIAL